MLILGINEACTRRPQPPVFIPEIPKECIRNSHLFVEANKIHVVKRKETLYGISAMYNISVQKIVRANGIKNPSLISVGQKLRIPREVISDIKWPVKGKISSYFGRRGKRGNHTGIDIPAPKGTPIIAVADGFVVASEKNLNGYSKYGRIVILEHGDGIRTLYAHNKKNHVRSGACISAGDVIAEVGSSGNATGPHLHFEIRKNGSPMNPLRYLP
ncbi:MAG: LysM peptidoglycan-binding domain-containing M23 family metallopeptidase [Thermodesulfobacteriota bacterium]